MKRLILLLTLMVLLSFACTSIRIADPAFSGPGGPTPDALATVLAEVAQATKNAPTATPEPPTPTPTEAVQEPDETGEPGAEPTATATPQPTYDTGFPTAISLPDPSASNFYACLSGCLDDGSNALTSFPAKTEIIYFQFEFEDFPPTAPYTRTWTKDGKLWAKYTCLWSGAQSGIDEITLTEPNGLASGTWNLVVTINGEEVLNETIEIEGSWTYWSPPGYFNSCYGKK